LTANKQQTVLRKWLMLLAFPALLLQVQPAFACSMMDIDGQVEDCCCQSSPDQPAAAELKTDTGCCEFSLTLTFAEPDERSAPLMLLSSQADSDPPDALPARVALDRSILTGPYSIARYHRASPAHPGTGTYLATLRLRI
jgi:hypothetical protein